MRSHTVLREFLTSTKAGFPIPYRQVYNEKVGVACVLNTTCGEKMGVLAVHMAHPFSRSNTYALAIPRSG